MPKEMTHKRAGASRRSFKKKLQAILDLPLTGEEDRGLAGGFGLDPAGADVADAILLGLCAKAKKGDTSCIKEIRSILGKDKAAADLRLKKQALRDKYRAGHADDGAAMALLREMLEDEE